MSDDSDISSSVVGLDRKKIKDFFLRKLPEMKEAVIDAIIEILPSVPHYQEENDHFTFRIIMGNGNPPMGWNRRIYDFSGDALENLFKERVKACLKDVIHFCKSGCDLIIQQMPAREKVDSSIQVGVFQSDLGNAGETERALLEKGFLLIECVNRSKICINSHTPAGVSDHLLIRFDLDENEFSDNLEDKDLDSYPKGFWAGLFSQIKREVHGTICLFVDPSWNGNEDENFDAGKIVFEDYKEMQIKPDSMLDSQSYRDLYEQNFIRKMFISMLNYDGITVIDTNGCVRAFHCFVSIHRGKFTSGGARHRAYRALANLFKDNECYKALYFQSQEGNIRFYHKFRVSPSFDSAVMDDDQDEVDNVNVVSKNADGMDGKTSSLASAINAGISESTPVDESSALSDYLDRLRDAHLGIDNFYNEPKPAEDLYNATLEMTDESWSRVNVERIINVPLVCLIGNSYGYSTNAEPFLKNILEKIPNSVWRIYLNNKCYEDSSLSSTLGSKNQESQWSKLMNETGTDDSEAEKYVTDELAEHIKTVYKHVSKQFAQKFEEERNLWEKLFKGY
ncbi:hypothetical protein [Fibrobacter sp. UWB12]|uniref:hypothetical protein n=1 Tax=Fibrobacter sp. UWB12 TaxID=1896203 RepID=UPI00091A37E9|nr:hypothetical protein [Fibrobacter sp. UWB12]SHK58721.1 hypothetical protein SAMN05720759_10454 [Fibrobacter sp. UWB12]